MGFGITRPDANRAAIGGDRLIELSPVSQGIAQVVVRLGQAGIQGNGPVICGDGLVQLSIGFQRITKIVVGCGRVRRRAIDRR